MNNIESCSLSLAVSVGYIVHTYELAPNSAAGGGIFWHRRRPNFDRRGGVPAEFGLRQPESNGGVAEGSIARLRWHFCSPHPSASPPWETVGTGRDTALTGWAFAQWHGSNEAAAISFQNRH